MYRKILRLHACSLLRKFLLNVKHIKKDILYWTISPLHMGIPTGDVSDNVLKL